MRRDGSPGRINRHVDIVPSGPAARAEAPLVVQVSRWDSMKDMSGVMDGFAKYVDSALGAHLVLAGPAVRGVADRGLGLNLDAEPGVGVRALAQPARREALRGGLAPRLICKA